MAIARCRWEHIAVSLARALSAFAVAIIIGIPLGLLMGCRMASPPC